MDVSIEPKAKTKKKSEGDATRKQIRGSSLLLFGKFISVGLNFAAQVLIVRYLSKTDFGAWSYALQVVAFFHGISTLGLRRGVTRFIPIYHERGEQSKLLGTIVLVLITIVLTGVIIVGGTHAVPELLTKLVKGAGQPVNVVLIMIFMVPVEALDGLLIALFASFASPKAIFFRKYILAPCLKLAAVLLLIFFESDVNFLAYNWVSAGALGVLIYGFVLIRLLYRQGTFDNMKFSTLQIPAKEIFAFTIPLMTSDLVSIFMHSADTLLLGYFHDTTEVGMYRVILPAAHFNKIVKDSFALLFTPLAARLFAKEDFTGINDLYWKTAVWMAVLSFPVFALTFSLAQPLTVLLYEARYESSWIYLAMISFAYYFNVVLGFNGLTLKVLGKIRYVVIINLVAALLNVTMSLTLIPKFGALGAAIATTAAMVIHVILKQAGLRKAAGMKLFDWHYLSFYLIIIAGAAGLFAVQFFLKPDIYIGVPLAALISFGVFWVTRKKLNVEETFPELLKVPGMKKIFGVSKTNK